MSWLALPPRRPGMLAPRSFRPVLEVLEDRLAPAVNLPSGFADISIAASGLVSPTALEVLPDLRVLITEQNGAIRVVQNNSLLAQPAITLSNVSTSGERGLLGITFDPNFASNQFIYVYYTVTAAANPSLPFVHNRISRLTLSGNTASSERVLWEFPDVGTAIYHMGGAIHFGPDGKLYVALGDTTHSSFAQSLTNPFGKIHRFDVSGATATIPTDNPFYNTATGDNRSIWALGLRNPFTTAFQPGSGRFYINDVGQSAWEEINLGQAGKNYGWPGTEGSFNPASFPNFTNPIYTYNHDDGCAITGGDFYNPQSVNFPSMYVGKYFFQDYCGGWIKTFDPETKEVGDFASGLEFPTDLRVAGGGAIYYITRGTGSDGLPASGSIGKIVYANSTAPVITSQPTDQTFADGATVTLTVTAVGSDPLSYRWQKLINNVWTPLTSGGKISGADSATLTISAATAVDGGRYRVVVSNNLGAATSNTAFVTSTANQSPTAQITAPLVGTTFQGGSVIKYAGTGSDPDDGAITSGSQFTWQVDFHHDDHVHPFIPPTSGSSGSFTIPIIGHTEGTVWYRIYLTVTDSQGLKATTFRDIKPQLLQIKLTTSVGGLQLKLDGQPKALPHSFSMVASTQRIIEAPLLQTLNGVNYQFTGWADNATAPAVRTIRPSISFTYVANYKVSPLVYVSDLPYAVVANGWGPVEKDRSNGEQAAGDGKPLTLNGVIYEKGLGVHAYSEISVPLNARYSTFQANVGVDDEIAAGGSVIFQVWVDGKKLYESPLLNAGSATQAVNVNVASRSELRLVVTAGPDNTGVDHADWANARLTKSSIVPALAAPGYLTATAVSSSQISLAWTDNSGNETGFQIRRATDSAFTQNVVTSAVGANVRTFQATGLAAGKTYYFQVRAVNATATSIYSYPASATTHAASAPVYVSDLPYTVVTNGWGPVEKDKSNGGQAAGDGNTITLGGVTYAKGLGVHANSEISVALNGQYATFLADIGVDDEVGTNGSVIFQVWADGVKLFESPLLTGNSATQAVSVNVSGRNQLRLVVTGGPDNANYDHADWANARLVK